MSVSSVILRRFERHIGYEVVLANGRKATLRVVDACSGELSCCVEFPDNALVWVDPERLWILNEPDRSRGGAG